MIEERTTKEGFMEDNKAFCVAPWVHFYSGEQGRVQACCVSGITYGSVKENSITELWQSESIQSTREKFLKGTKDKRCSYCYKVEDSGNISLRQQMNEKYFMYAEKIIKGEEVSDFPVYYDIRFSNLCNLRCRTCWHGASSKWFDDAKVLGTTVSGSAIIQNIPSSFLEENLTEIINNAEEFYFAGGEPLVTEEVYTLLDELIKQNRTDDVLIRLNTNLTHLKFGKRSIIDLLKKFSKVELQISLDHVFEKAEYIRKDLKWSVFYANIKQVQELLPHVKIVFHPTISVLNVFDWPEIETYIQQEFNLGKENIYLNFLSRPDYYCIQNLSEVSKNKIRKKFQKSIVSNLSTDILSFLNVQAKDKEMQLFQYLKQLDKIRAEDYKQVLGWLIP